jgi:DNA-binding LytR/AlgR family response regulator
MRIIIIEDELFTARDLADCILKVLPDTKITAILSSVKEASNFFKTPQEVDLIFSDIQLGDGLSFEIFENISSPAPIIFCTAYDEYALRAFKAAGIDYILKPFTVNTIRIALDRYYELKGRFNKAFQTDYHALKASMAPNNGPDSLLVNYKTRVIPIKFADISLFYIHNEITHLFTFTNQRFFINKTLEEIEHIMPANFFRASRQHIINKKTIRDVSQHFGRKLLLNLNIPCDEKITVSKARSKHFLKWLSGRQEAV